MVKFARPRVAQAMVGATHIETALRNLKLMHLQLCQYARLAAQL